MGSPVEQAYNKWTFSLRLKTQYRVSWRIYRGREFHKCGALKEKARRELAKRVTGVYRKGDNSERKEYLESLAGAKDINFLRIQEVSHIDTLMYKAIHFENNTLPNTQPAETLNVFRGWRSGRQSFNNTSKAVLNPFQSANSLITTKS